MIFLAEFLLTRNFVLRVEEDSELLLEFTNTKLTREHVYFIHFRDGFIGACVASFMRFGLFEWLPCRALACVFLLRENLKEGRFLLCR